jgi:hypothetical protein
MVASLAPSSRLMLWPTRARRLDITYNPDNGSKAYSNPTVYSRLSEYTAMAQEVHGPDYNPRTEDIDGDVLMRVGGGTRHGRY